MNNKNTSSLCILLIMIVILSFSNPVTSNISTTQQSMSVSGYVHFKEIVIDHNKVIANLIDFPLLFTTIDSDLVDCQVDGDDIVFYDETGANQLNHEIEKFDNTTGELIAWVQLPYLSNTTDTIIRMVYNNPSAVNSEKAWKVWEEYEGVYHLSNLTDSTTMNNLTQVGTVLTNDNGKFAAAQMFDGYGMDYLTTNTNFGLTTTFTIECWVNINGADTDQTFISLPHSFTGTGARLMLNWDDDIALARNYNTSSQGSETYGTSPINDSVWHYLVHTYDNQSNNLYVDGQLEGSDPHTGTVQSYYNRFFIGREGDYSAANWQETVLFGLIDDVTVSKSVFSAAQITTEYNNQQDPTSFYSISPAIATTTTTTTTTDPTTTTTDPTTTTTDPTTTTTDPTTTTTDPTTSFPTITSGFLPASILSMLFCLYLIKRFKLH